MDRTRAALLNLALGYFAIGATLTSVVGIINPLAADLRVSPARIALLVTAFAIIFALAAPATQMIAGRVERRTLLLTGLGLLAAGGLIAALAPNYQTLVAGRAAAALGAAIFGPTALAAGTLLVPAREQGRALGTVFGGISVATVAGVPLVAWLGDTVGWRPALAAVAVVAAAAAVGVRILVPTLGSAGPVRPAVYLATARTPGVPAGIATTGLWMAAQFSIYALASAYLAARYDAGTATVTATLFAFGVAGVTGNAVATRLSDRLGPARLVRIAQAILAAALLALLVLPGQPGFAVAAFAIWGFASQLFQAPQQSRLVSLAPQQRGIVLALNAATLYLGISLGSIASGLVYTATGATWLPLPALVLLAGAIVVSLPRPRRRTSPVLASARS